MKRFDHSRFQLMIILMLCLAFSGPPAYCQSSKKIGFEIVPLDKDYAFVEENLEYDKKIDAYILWKEEARKIIDQLHDKAFLAASVDSISGDSANIKAYLTVGKTYQWVSLEPGNVSDEALSKAGYRQKMYLNEPFSYTALTGLFNQVLNFYENHGYPFVNIKLDSISTEKGKVRAKLKVNPGSLYTIDSISIEGEVNITNTYIENYFGIKPGDLYSDKKIKAISNRIKELPFLALEKDFILTFSDDEVNIILYLEKKNASRFNGILGVLPDDEGKVLLTGDIQLFLQNSFGKGEIINFNWKKLQQQTQDLEFQFSYPYLFDTPFGFDYDFNLYKRDTSFITLNHIVGTRYSLYGNNYLKLFLNNRVTSVLSEDALRKLPADQKSPYGDVTSNLYGLGFHFENLDYRLNPKRGYDLETDFALGQKKIKQSFDSENDTLDPSSVQYNASLAANLYIPLGGRHVIRLGNQSAFTESDEIFENELYRIGGLKTLRGFDEESINTSLYTIATFEYRFILEQNSYFHLFFDGAYYENLSRSTRVIDRPFGFGAGVSFETNAGIFSLSYALGKQFNNPVLLRAAKIHFGFVNYF